MRFQVIFHQGSGNKRSEFELLFSQLLSIEQIERIVTAVGVEFDQALTRSGSSRERIRFCCDRRFYETNAGRSDAMTRLRAILAGFGFTEL